MILISKSSLFLKYLICIGAIAVDYRRHQKRILSRDRPMQIFQDKFRKCVQARFIILNVWRPGTRWSMLQLQTFRLAGCPYRKLNPDVSVVQSAQNWHSQYATAWLDGARRRRVLVQWQVRSGTIVIIGISSKQMAKMPLAKHYHMIKAFPSDRAD